MNDEVRRVGGPRLRLALIAALAALAVIAAPVSAVTGWTGPVAIVSTAGCADVSAAIDSNGRNHVAASCGDQVRYSSSPAGGAWSTAAFAHPTGKADIDPHVAIDGNRVYVAFTRIVPLDCGVQVVGVYFRWKTLSATSWSAATILGLAGDRLQSFRVLSGKIHATVGSGNVTYETLAGGVLKRYLLTGAGANSSLRIGSDGKARIVYQVPLGLRFAIFNGTSFSSSAIPGTVPDDHHPLLALDGQNRAYVIWSHQEEGGCAGPGVPTTPDGTYYATNRTGSWTAVASRRFTSMIGATAMTLDAASGRTYVLVTGGAGLRYFSKPAVGAWTSQTLLTSAPSSVAIRRDASSGILLAVYTTSNIRVLTRP